VTFDPDALRDLGGRERPGRRPATPRFLLRVGTAAGIGAAATNAVVWLLATWGGWLLEAPDGTGVGLLPVILVCVITGVVAALGAYAAARVTKHPALWVAVVGGVLLLASVQGLAPTLVAMHVVTGVWVVGWLTRATLRGSYLAG
jgi:hypothetical protein